MNRIVKWLKENVGDNIEIITPQFERGKPLDFEYKPKTKEEFQEIVDKAPWAILKGLGFGKWDTMNNCIKENMGKPVHEEIEIPIINGAEGETVKLDIGHGGCPTKLLEVDEDILLFPAEWYDIIPDGFMVTGLYGESYPFEHGKSDDDRRFGCLAYGIRRKVEATPCQK